MKELILGIGKVSAAQISGPGSGATPIRIINNIVPIIYSVVGVALFGYFVYGGFTWLTSSGEPEKMKKAQDMMINAAIGAAIVVFAYLGTRVVGGIVGFNLYS